MQTSCSVFQLVYDHLNLLVMKKKFYSSYPIFLLCLLVQLICTDAKAQSKWPQEFNSADGTKISVYEPQAEKYAGNELYARAAVSIRKKENEEPVFGVMWFKAGVQADGNMAAVKSAVVDKSKFADGDTESNDILKDAFEKNISNANLSLDISKVQSQVDQIAATDAGIKADAPTIYYRDKPTTLIVLDGEPVEQMDDDLKMLRVMNSPFLIVKNPDDKNYYLYGGSFWYKSSSVKDGWSNVKSLPSKIKPLDAMMKEEEKKAATDKEEVNKFSAPTDILVSTEPAELIQTEGEPTYKPVEGSTLLYVDNSLDEIFKNVESQKNYILLSGRWYSSKAIAGPWEYVPADALPAAFASIPKGSEKDGVLASVAGTAEADEAIVDANVPQTAKVDRTAATCTVTYDGTPKFVPIEKTNLSLAENSNLTVMLAPNNQYYALENGIWFKSNSANGPWEVANERPQDVDKIPVSSAAYNARYVYIYETSPRYVYVGYTPGYMGNYIWRHTVVWGTGWRYRPWFWHRYYPRPYTWGFGMHYNPWSGWSISFGLGFNTGWWHYNRYRGWGGWFGPPMYRPPYRPWGWNGGFYGYRATNRVMYRPNVVTNRPPGWNRPQPMRPAFRQINMYDRRRDVVLTRDRVQRPTRPGIDRPSVNRPVIEKPINRPRPNDQLGGRPTRPSVTPSQERPVNRPVTKPSFQDRPSRPVVKPSRPQADRPSVRPVDRKPISRPAKDKTERPGRGVKKDNG